MEQMKIQGKRIMLSDPNNPNNKREATMGEVVTLFEKAQTTINELTKSAGKKVIFTDNNTKQQREATHAEIIKIYEMEQTKNNELTQTINKMKQENESLKQIIQNNINNQSTQNDEINKEQNVISTPSIL